MVVECINLIAKCYTRQTKSQIIKFIDTCKKKDTQQVKTLQSISYKKASKGFYQTLNPTKEIQEKQNGKWSICIWSPFLMKIQNLQYSSIKEKTSYNYPK
jgi:hypothetical protein